MGPTDEEREQALAALADFQNEAAALRESLRRYESVLERVRRDVEHGIPLHEVMNEIGVANRRLDLVERLTRFEDARHRMRVACFRLSHAEGLNISAIARLWGISRQLAARFIKEANNPNPKSQTPKTTAGALPPTLQQMLPRRPAPAKTTTKRTDPGADHS